MVSISGKCPGHPFLIFWIRPGKARARLYAVKNPTCLLRLLKNISMMALCLKKSWETCKGIGSPKQVQQFLKNRESFTICLYLYMPHQSVDYAGISI